MSVRRQKTEGRRQNTGSQRFEREARQCEEKLAALRTAIDVGDASGIADEDEFDRVRQILNLRTAPLSRPPQ